MPFEMLEKIYNSHKFMISNIVKEPESQEYSAYSYTLNSLKIIFRTAKITPKKVGQFVTLWKREGAGSIQPYDLSDDIDFFVIHIAHNQYCGQFVFSKRILHEKDIVSNNKKGGKRAMRVYAPWDITESRQAKNTQAWQTQYFLNIPNLDYTKIDKKLIGKLYSI